jgi:hypothetical protein
MSDTNYWLVNQSRPFVDIMDDQWAKDTLSDDEIEVQDDVFHVEDDDEEGDIGANRDDNWNDTGLDRFINEQVVVAPAIQSTVTSQHQASTSQSQ